MEQTKTSSYRLEYLDWVRGIGAVIMLQGHVFHSFLRPELKTTGAYTLSQFVGGMPPALFLFLTGITLAFLMDSIERKGLAPRRRVLESLRRAGYLFFLAFAFRLQLWVFGMPAPWQGLFKVDVLNCMGISIALLYTLFFGALLGLATVILAIKGTWRPLFFVWSLVVTLLLLKGYIFSRYHFSPGEFRTAMCLIVGSVIALMGAWVQMGRKAGARR